jgi:uncharacterized phage protein gp47/JayE
MAYASQQKTIFQNMVNYIQDPSNWPDGVSKFSNLIVGDPLYVLLSAVSVAVDTNAYAIYLARQAANISTAIGDDLDNKAADYGVTRKQAEAASSPFTLVKFSPSISPTPIVKGSLISTLPDSSGTVITFIATEDATLPAGQTQVNINAICQTLGTAGNLVANTPMLISSAIPGIDGVQLTTDITNGVDKESDDSLRARTLAAFASLATGTLDWYEQTALKVTGIQSAVAVPQNRGPGTVDVFIVGENNTIPSTDLQSQVQSKLNAGRPITDDAKEQIPSALVVNTLTQIHLLPGYDPALTCAAVQAAQTNYINSLGSGAGELGYIYAVQLTSVATSIPGVVNATTTFIDTPVSKYQLPQANTINVTPF